MLHWSVLLLSWMCRSSSWALHVPYEAEPAFASGTVDPLQPLHSQETNPDYRRRLSQSSGSEDEDDLSCNLTSAQRRRFYNASSHEWLVTDEVLEELDNDLQSIVACTLQDDFIFFSTERRIKPRRSISILRRLTLSSQSVGLLFSNGVISETQRKARITCPDEGDLLTVRGGSITVANMIFSNCNRTGNVIVLDSRCNDRSVRRVVRFVHTEFRNHVISDNQRLLETADPSCLDIMMESVVIRNSQCELGCMSLSRNNTLRNVRVNDIAVVANGNTIDVPSVFVIPGDSEIVATNISASRNRVRLFSIVDSKFTLKESIFNRNTMIHVNLNVSESVGGSVLFSDSSMIDISNSVFVNNSGWNGGAVYASASEFNLNNCTFSDNDADIGNGGALYAINGTSITFSRCTFFNNYATRGAGIFSDQISSIRVTNSRFLNNLGNSGSGLYAMNGNMTIKSCTFRRNYASFGGSALVISEVYTSILDSTFLNNMARWGGACMFQNDSSVRMTRVKFTRNHAPGGGEGGAIYADHTTLDFHNVSFDRNSAINDVAAMYIGNGSVSFVDVNVTKNFAGSDASIHISNSSASFDRVLFRRNRIDGAGAGFYSYKSNVTVTRSLFHTNTALRSGAIHSVRGSLLIRETNFTNNTATLNAGGCFFRATNTTLRNLVFRRNRANDQNGGGLDTFRSDVIGQDLLFEYNNADLVGGGGFFARTNVELKNVIFRRNIADDGGGLSVKRSRIIGEDVLFEYNHARDLGGGYAGSHSLVSLSRSQFINNTAGVNGGGIFVSNSRLNLTGPCLFRRNYAEVDGGAICTSTHSNASITSCMFDSNAAEHGGSFWTAYYTHSRVVNCSFINSTARYGGGVKVYETGAVSITNSNFTRCRSHFRGGGINVETHSNLTISFCRFLRNQASEGAGLYVWNANLDMYQSVFKLGRAVAPFHGNSFGGGIYSGRGSITIRNSSFERNIVEDGSGGGISGHYGSSILVEDTEIIGNSAISGAGLFAEGVNASNYNSVNFVENEAKKSGGGTEVKDTTGVQSFNNCRFVRNTAGEGGCLAGFTTKLRIANMMCEENIVRKRGGGLFFDNSSITMSDTRVISSQARNFSGILVTESSQVMASNLSSNMNIASEDGGGIGVVNGSSLLCSQCKFQHNMATRGAGLYVESNDSAPLAAQLQDSSVLNNSALTYGGGMLFIRPQNVSIDCNVHGTTCSRVALLNTDLQNNSAGQSGAAVLTSDPEGVLISCTQQRRQNTFLEADQLSSLKVINPMSLCSSWKWNQVARNAPGDIIGTFGRVLSFSTEPDDEIQFSGDVNSGFIVENVASGVQLPVIFVTVLDAYGNGPVVTSPSSFAATMVSPDGFFQGAVTTNIAGGVGNFSNIVGFKTPGNYTLRIFPGTDSLPVAELVVHVRSCEIGEEPTENRELCENCDALSFNFNPEQPGGCAPCPSDASCANRFIIPKDGYWHKSPCHTSVKECLTNEACSYKERQHQLGNFTEDFHDCKFNQTTLMEYGNVSCRDGYEGPLCGSCAKGYGLSLGFKCSKCASDFASIITLSLFTLYLLAISSFTIRGGLPVNLSNIAATESSSCTSVQEESSEVQKQQDVNINFKMAKMLRDAYVPPEHFKKLEAQKNKRTVSQRQSQQQQLNEVELTRWIATEIFKVMINFLQVIAVAATINVRWTDGVLVMFEASEYMGALTTAALSRPIDCLVSSSSAAVRSVWRTLLSLFVPGVVMGIFASFWGIFTCYKSKGLSYFWKRVTLSIIAVTYISYLGLTKLAVRIFYCVDVYDSDDIFSNSQTKVWAIDTSIHCYEREHTSLIVIAVLIMVLVSISFPLMSAVILSCNKVKHRDTNSWIMETMGFLYRAFKEEYVFWESLVMLRKACLSIIVVFSYPLGGQAQGVLALVVLLSSHYLHFVCSPYRKEFHSLNYYESGSLLVSSMTFILSQWFSAERSSDSTRMLFAVIIVTMNSLFFTFLSIVLFRSGIVHLKTLLKSEDNVIDDNACWWEVLKVLIKSKTSKWTCADN